MGCCAGILDAIAALMDVILGDMSGFRKRKPEFVLTASKCHYPDAGHPGLTARQTGLFASRRGVWQPNLTHSFFCHDQWVAL